MRAFTHFDLISLKCPVLTAQAPMIPSVMLLKMMHLLQITMLVIILKTRIECTVYVQIIFIIS